MLPGFMIFPSEFFRRARHRISGPFRGHVSILARYHTRLRAAFGIQRTEQVTHVMDEWTELEGSSTARFVTEGKIRTVLIDELEVMEAGDRLDVAMFYL